MKKSYTTIKIAGTIPESYTDGEGIRYALFTQGCAHACKDCHNPETWDFNGGAYKNITDIFSELCDNELLDGITFTGGDPMYQAGPCSQLAKLIKENTDLNIWCYTGFTFDECLEHPDMREFLRYIDVLVDGPYEESCRSLHIPFKGSSNQRIIDVKKSFDSNNIVIYE